MNIHMLEEAEEMPPELALRLKVRCNSPLSISDWFKAEQLKKGKVSVLM